MLVQRDRTARTLKLSQPRHIDDIINTLNLGNAGGRPVPMAPGADTTPTKAGEQLPDDPSLYAKAVGMLLYVANTTRPDLALAVSTLARCMTNPPARHFRQLKAVGRYLQATRDAGIVYGRTTAGPLLVGYTDADYAGCPVTRRSRGGYAFLLFGGAIAWQTKLQSIVAQCTAESEYVALALAARHAVWTRRLMADLPVHLRHPLVINVDNQAAIFMTNNSADSARTKHIDVRHHFVRDAVQRQEIQLQYCQTDLNCADIFTKPLAEDKVLRFRTALGVC